LTKVGSWTPPAEAVSAVLYWGYLNAELVEEERPPETRPAPADAPAAENSEPDVDSDERLDGSEAGSEFRVADTGGSEACLLNDFRMVAAKL